MEYDQWLFSGEIVNGHLSNEISLHKDCPPEFRDVNNPWTACVLMFLRLHNKGRGGMLMPWEPKQFYSDRRANELECQRRETCFTNMLHSYHSSLKLEHRAAVMAWMLSEMLSEVPQYVPITPLRYN